MPQMSNAPIHQLSAATGGKQKLPYTILNTMYTVRNSMPTAGLDGIDGRFSAETASIEVNNRIDKVRKAAPHAPCKYLLATSQGNQTSSNRIGSAAHNTFPQPSAQTISHAPIRQTNRPTKLRWAASRSHHHPPAACTAFPHQPDRRM